MPENVFELSADGVSYRMQLPNSDVDYIQRKLATEHTPYELPMLEDMRGRLAAGDLVVDAGANIGNHTMYLAAVAGCRVVAFEPNTSLATALRSSLDLNALGGKVEVRELGLGKEASRGQFTKDIPDNLGAQSITSGEGPLEIVTLDSIPFPAPVKAIKIDVEGMELDVLAGARELIRRDRPILYVESPDQASFRRLHQWMVANNYGYWDTFNATPTHLFLPNEKTTVDERLSRLQLKGTQDIYQLQEQIGKTREMLDNANTKYRAAGEQIATLKVQLAQQEAARKTAEQAASSAQGQLTSTRDRLESERAALQGERAALQSEVQRLGALAESHKDAAYRAEKELIRIEAALEIARSQVADREKKEAQVEELSTKLGTVSDQLASTRDALHEANRKYRVATEQIQDIRRKAEHDDSLAKMAAESATRSNAQLIDNQTRLIEERASLLARIENDSVLAKMAAEAAAKSTVELADTQKRLIEERASLLARIENDGAQARMAAEAAAKNNAQLVEAQHRLSEERNALLGQIDKLRAESDRVAKDASDLEKKLASIESALQVEKDALAQANERYREATAQVATLKERVAQEEQAARAAERLWGDTQAELHGLREALDGATSNHHAATRELRDLKTELEQKERAALATESALKTELEQKERAALAAESALKTELEQKEREARATESTLKTELEQKEREARATESTLHQRASDLSRQLNEANLKYRRVTGEEVPQLKARIQSTQAQVNEHKQTLEQLKRELASNKKTLQDANRQLERVRQQKMQAEQQVIKTRASLSFQLGYILINGFKSFRGFIGIPGALLAWRKDVLKRRKQKAERLEKLQPAVPAAHARATPVRNEAPVPPSPAPVSAALEPVQRPAVQPVAADVLPRDLRRLKVACIMDEFTFGSYRAECDLFQLTPANWEAELDTFKPQLLFIESAWRGKDELWGNKVGHNSQELQGIVAWCRRHAVPTVFWNKEDPVHFETFLSSAALFDCVFTTDIDCIHRYKAALKHDKVFLLPFACQPRNNHPIETYERKDAFCFAGAYYVRYPDRTRDLGNMIGELPAFRPVEIYDRNYGKDNPNYMFPPEYQPFIVGTLPFDQIDKAYKGYRYAINLNSIKQSQTMFARRVYELMASNTITVSNFSRGIRLMFGDLVITTDSGHEMVRHLTALGGDEVRGAKLRLAALRKVLQEHTYEQRLAYVVSKVAGEMPPSRLPKIAVLAQAANGAELDRILANVQRQTYANCVVHVLLADNLVPAAIADGRVRFVSQADVAGKTVAALAGDAAFVAGMTSEDYYGPHYLLDIALATTYTDAEAIGKNAHYSWVDGSVALQDAGTAYRPAQRFAVRRAAIRSAAVADAAAAAWVGALPSAVFDTDSGIAIDEFNYCQNGQNGGHDSVDVARIAAAVDDLPGLDTGMPIAELLRLAERIPPAENNHEGGRSISGKHLAGAFGRAPSAAVRVELDGDNWCVQSSLADGKHEYLYATTDYTLDSLGWTDKAQFYFDMTPGLNLQIVLVFLDAQKQKIAHVIKQGNRNHEVDVPLGTAGVRLGLRIYAGGSTEIKGLVLGHRDLQPAEIIGKADHLVVTNHYPSYDDLYRNGFVHSRVIAYRERGIRSDVFRMRAEEPVSYHEFEDVDVTTGSQAVLHQMLSSGRYKTVMVHFLDASMWEVLRQHIDRVKVIVWVHGAEIQPWHRRDFNNKTDDQRTVAKMKSEARMTFWRALLNPMPANLKLVFVSRYFSEEVMEDLGFRIPAENYEIIHNPIDVDTFTYREKPSEQRKKVLSIRPFASPTYANDLSVQAIQLLAQEPWFNEMEFRIIGDGPLFDELLAPLRKFDNVFIEKRFLKRTEIAALHKEYGIFLSPTRMDTQGVSRDEAMASGLVPVTNAVAAVPEFVDERSGILAPAEDARMLAQGIAELVRSPDRFQALSREAAENVRRQRGKDRIIAAEIKVIR